MKLEKLSLFGLSAMMLTAVSCSDDNVMPDPDQTLKADQSFYIPINVNGFGADGTRANGEGNYGNDNTDYNPNDEPNFDPGIGAENEVESVYLVFYDSKGARLSATDALKNLHKVESEIPSENALYTGVVKVDVERGQNIPAYVLAFVNPTHTTDFMNSSDFATLADVEKSTRESLIDASGKFAMSNSVYYGTDEVTKATDFRIMATPIGNGKLFNNETDAQKALDEADGENSSAVDIYVERYAGKVNFSIGEIKDLEIGDKTLTFVPEAWAVNADEDESFITKTFFGQVGESNEFNWNAPATFDSMNSLLTWKWNSEANHRSYWGQSPSYYTARYPRVADDILDEIENDPTLGEKGTYDLKYYSYTEITNNAKQTDNKAKARTIANTSPLYPRENTVAGKSLWSAYDNPYASPRAAIASVVLVGHYEVDGEEIDKNVRFYVTGNSTNGYNYYEEAEMRDLFLSNTIDLASDATGKKMDFDTDDTRDYIIIDHPSQAVRGGLVMDSRYVTLQLTPKAINNVYAKSGDSFVLVTEENIDAINQNVMSAAGTAFGFKGGKAYYNIPIQHLGYYRQGNTNLTEFPNGANSANFGWKNVKSGDFGIVRNHVYTIKATTIMGLGNAIPREDDPIVPPTDPDEYYIGARIIVLNWAIVPTQSVVL